MSETNILDEIFNQSLKNTHIFKDREVLRHDYIPDNLPHRAQQIRYLGEIVAPVLRNSRCSNIFIYGKTGTGKTAATKYVFSILVRRS